MRTVVPFILCELGCSTLSSRTGNNDSPTYFVAPGMSNEPKPCRVQATLQLCTCGYVREIYSDRIETHIALRLR